MLTIVSIQVLDKLNIQKNLKTVFFIPCSWLQAWNSVAKYYIYNIYIYIYIYIDLIYENLPYNAKLNFSYEQK